MVMPVDASATNCPCGRITKLLIPVQDNEVFKSARVSPNAGVIGFVTFVNETHSRNCFSTKVFLNRRLAKKFLLQPSKER